MRYLGSWQALAAGLRSSAGSSRAMALACWLLALCVGAALRDLSEAELRGLTKDELVAAVLAERSELRHPRRQKKLPRNVAAFQDGSVMFSGTRCRTPGCCRRIPRALGGTTASRASSRSAGTRWPTGSAFPTIAALQAPAGCRAAAEPRCPQAVLDANPHTSFAISDSAWRIDDRDPRSLVVRSNRSLLFVNTTIRGEARRTALATR